MLSLFSFSLPFILSGFSDNSHTYPAPPPVLSSPPPALSFTWKYLSCWRENAPGSNVTMIGCFIYKPKHLETDYLTKSFTFLSRIALYCCCLQTNTRFMQLKQFVQLSINLLLLCQPLIYAYLFNNGKKIAYFYLLSLCIYCIPKKSTKAFVTVSY